MTQLEEAERRCRLVFTHAHVLRVRARFQLLLSDGPEALHLHVDTHGDEPTFERAQKPADVVFEMSADDLIEGAEGRRDLGQQFARGSLRVTGELRLALALHRMMVVERSRRADQNLPLEVLTEKRASFVRRESERLAASRPRLMTVERIERPSVAVFRSRYLLLGTPVVIEGAVSHWPLSRATWESVGELLGGFRGYSRHGDYVRDAFSDRRELRAIDIGAFAADLPAGSGEADGASMPAYAANNAWPKDRSNLIEPPPYFSASEYRPDSPRIWVGPGGTVTPLHRDGTDNLFVQVLGRKQVLLGSPDQWTLFYTWTLDPTGMLEGCDVDAEKPDFDRFPSFKDAHLLRIELGPRDMLFIPEGWFHHVRSLEPSLSVNFWTSTSRGRPR